MELTSIQQIEELIRSANFMLIVKWLLVSATFKESFRIGFLNADEGFITFGFTRIILTLRVDRKHLRLEFEKVPSN